jgi:hypothetical protein
MPAKSKRVRACRSGKGRVTGARRAEVNDVRSDGLVTGAIDAKQRDVPFETLFARVTGHLGMGRVKANLPSDRGITEIQVQIPNLLGRKGATPINSQTVVAVFVGKDFNPNKFDATVHFKMTCIISPRQVGALAEAGVVPEWMTVSDAAAVGGAGVDTGITFDYTGAEGDEDEDSEEASEGDDSEEEEAKKAVKAAEEAAKAEKERVAKAKADESPFDLFGSGETVDRTPHEDEGFDFFSCSEPVRSEPVRSEPVRHTKAGKVDHRVSVRNTVVMGGE